MKHLIHKLSIYVFFANIYFCWPAALFSQHIPSALRIEGDNEIDGYEYMIQDNEGNYYVGLEYSTWTKEIRVGDTKREF